MSADNVEIWIIDILKTLTLIRKKKTQQTWNRMKAKHSGHGVREGKKHNKIENNAKWNDNLRS